MLSFTSGLAALAPLLGIDLHLAAENTNAPLSALVWWIIPIVALTGGLAYAYWVTRLKSKYDNQTERSVGRFKKFQDSFQYEAEDGDKGGERSGERAGERAGVKDGEKEN
ncbi:MAG: hypothetical protein ACKOF0_02090 [Actinomycetota bacterium]